MRLRPENSHAANLDLLAQRVQPAGKPHWLAPNANAATADTTEAAVQDEEPQWAAEPFDRLIAANAEHAMARQARAQAPRACKPNKRRADANLPFPFGT